jgi:uncharacterized protein involved in type VI secretion and phage assembly
VIGDNLLRALLAPANSDGRIFGAVIGVVTNNRDPENMHRVKVRFPWLNHDDESNWARVASPMAGKGRGAYFLPEVEDEVLLAFEHGCIERPYVIGALWNGKDGVPDKFYDADNNNRGFRSRSGHVVRLCDQSGQESIEIVDNTGSNKIVIETSENKITIEALGDISITSQTGKLTLSAVGVEITSKANVQVQAVGQVDVKGTIINLN